MPSNQSPRRFNPFNKAALATRFLLASGLAGVILAGLMLPAVGSIGLGAKDAVTSFDSLPADFTAPQPSQASTIYDANGGVIATVWDRDRTVVTQDQMSPLVREALVDIEDNRFYQHGAIDLKGIARALGNNSSGGGTQGASTLTQQYVKNVFVDEAGDDQQKVLEAQRQTVGRKIQEMRYAIQVEQTLTKDQILTNYLNITFFGEQAYGVEAASERYFSVHANQLTLPQAAMLAGLEQSPTNYDPLEHPVQAKERRDTVLKKMAQYGSITQDQANQAIAVPIASMLKPTPPHQGCITAQQGEGFFCDYVKQTVLGDPAFGATAAARQALWNRGGLQIHTTIDPKAQGALQTALSNNANTSDKPAAVMTEVQPGTGKITAMGQSREYGFNSNQTTINLNVGKSMGGGLGFQTGSTFKPIVAAAAMENGIGPDTTYPAPQSMLWPAMKNCSGGKYPSVDTLHNDPGEVGPYNMPVAMADSINTYFAQLEADTGLCTVDQMANKMGITQQANGDPLSVVPSMVLGSNDLTPLEMAAVYATFADHGTYCTPIAISSVTDPNGKQLAVPSANCTEVMSQNTADTISAMLKGVVEDGTGTSAGLTDRDNAGKTGTTNDGRQVWFVGYTPDLAGATLVSDTAAQNPLQGQMFGGSPIASAFGGPVAGPIWKAAMEGSLAGTPADSFPSVSLPSPVGGGGGSTTTTTTSPTP
ncbi:transglycosylase domain-containing protein [Kitasatospora sp. NPDC052896]|uniref:transglycosylase domain-containing protein n=1 Tax=Kitasatospora sp. NPDC052896 TaxID=3364061 RepID=UPI0037C7F17B